MFPSLPALALCLSGFLGLPMPGTMPTVYEVSSAKVQIACSTGRHNLVIYGCYRPWSQESYVDAGRVKKARTLAHEMAHHIVSQAGADVPHREIYWAAEKAETWCRQ